LNVKTKQTIVRIFSLSFDLKKQSTKLQPENLTSSSGEAKDPEEYKRRLYQELLSRDSEKNVSEHTQLLTLSFKDKNFEHQYRNSRDITSCVSLLGLPLTLFCYLIAYLLIGLP
jgi:hypothetical protein